MNSTGSFFKFLAGFLTFVGVSVVVTITVNTYASAQDGERQAAAAIKAMFDKTVRP